MLREAATRSARQRAIADPSTQPSESQQPAGTRLGTRTCRERHFPPDPPDFFCPLPLRSVCARLTTALAFWFDTVGRAVTTDFELNEDRFIFDLKALIVRMLQRSVRVLWRSCAPFFSVSSKRPAIWG